MGTSPAGQVAGAVYRFLKQEQFHYLQEVLDSTRVQDAGSLTPWKQPNA